MANRLARGRRYARSGRILRLEIEPGRVEALVQGSRYEPYRVRVRLRKFTEHQWGKVIEALASKALFAAKLLAGQMPENIEEAFDGAGHTLFPSSRRDLETTCSCPDDANPCKHIAAVHFALADQFDHDPFLLFRLRGRGRDQLLKDLRSHRAADAAGVSPARDKTGPLIEKVDRFWESGKELESIAVTVGPPTVSASLLKRLGVPGFWKPHPEIRGALERLYAKVTERSMALAYGGQGNNSVRKKQKK
jgi:uncharacterized Zn finger protein